MELLERFALGDLEAFETLFRQFQGQAYRWIVRIVRDPGVAEDLTVETFWRVYRAHARFRPDGNFGAWVRRIATNAAFDHLKRARREVPLADDFPAGARPDPAVRREKREKIAQAFLALPIKLRVAATLALIEEEPYETIAEELGISVGGVKSRVWRAIRLLREKLKGLGAEP
ncbi:MAG TPA: sigma-70 family RNA polymerase sigma factor [Candidatus Acidoferrales bacterium]|nr:sigma-70 family RNA polymerase sigma factor [Candidatus Acidoferrales bacterium]